MDPELRNALIGTGAVAALLIAGVIGFAIGRSGRDEVAAPPAVATPAPTIAAPTGDGVEQPTTPAAPAAITPAGQILRARGGAVTPGVETLACNSLVSPGVPGQCGEVLVGTERVVWIVESRPDPEGGTAFAARILTYSAEDGGWLERLQADDPQGERWSNVTVLPTDLTGDGVPELVAGFRRLGERGILEYDIVGYRQDGRPEVFAHPDPAGRGSVLVQGGVIEEYAGQYAEGDQDCCPSSFEHRTVVFDSGFFRVDATEIVSAGSVPASQL
jgi:hypothetical protein